MSESESESEYVSTIKPKETEFEEQPVVDDNKI
jgi:hypothetical protein